MNSAKSGWFSDGHLSKVFVPASEMDTVQDHRNLVLSFFPVPVVLPKFMRLLICSELTMIVNLGHCVPGRVVA